MGFHDRPRGLSGPSTFPEVTPAPESADSVLGAAFRRENTIGAILNAVPDGAYKSDAEYEATFGRLPDASFNAWDVIENTRYESYGDILGAARSRVELDQMLSAIDQQEADAETLGKAGGSGVAASMLAGFVDVPSLIPGLAPLRGARTTANAMRVASSAAQDALASEAVLQSMQVNRSAEETAFALGGSFVLGGALGAGVSRIINRAPGGQDAFKRSADAMDGKPVEAGDDLDPATRESINAARAEIKPTNGDFGLATPAAQKAVDFTPSGINFGLTFAKAKSAVAQKFGLDMLETPYAFQGVDRLAAEPAVETAAKVIEDRARVAAARIFREGFSEYRKAHGVGRVQAQLGQTDITARRFAEEVAFTLRRGDVHPDPAVQKAAQQARKEIIEPLKERAINAGLLPEDVSVTTAASYFTRMWDADSIVQRAPEFKRRLTQHFASDWRAGRAAGNEEFDMPDVELDGYAQQAAEDVYNTLVNRNRMPEGLGITVKARGPMKERTLNVRDEEFEDFLINDAEYVLNRYARVMSADIELKTRFGSTDLEDTLREVQEDYDKLIDSAATPKERAELDAEKKRVLERAEAVRDLMRGTYQVGMKAGVPYRVLQSAMSYNFIRALGGLVLSALPDVYRFAMTHGVSNLWSGALRPMMRDLKQYKIAAAQARELAGIAETQLNNRLMAIADITDPTLRQTPVERTIQNMASLASTFSGGTLWNDFLKGMATQVTTNRLRNLTNSKSDRAFLDRLKLNSRDAGSIRDAMKKHGVEVGGVFDPRVDDWPERIRDIYTQAIRADADTVIVTPGIGDKVPVVEHHFWLKPAMQFKSFALAAHGRTMVAGLQEDQARFLISAGNMAAMGMFVYYLKALSSGREPTDNPGTWIAEGIDRSGVFPLVMEVNNIAESLGAPGVYNILSMGEDEASRYAVRNFSGRVLGPTAGLMSDTATILSRGLSNLNPMASEDSQAIKAGDIGAARRLVPFGRHPGVKEYLDLWLVPELKEGL